ncbi:MAG TPA: HAD family phosphatase [Candidatus Synoicihabitans sp.]|nr:HAD family phosphatase [Candidatus Synoicihabitans sp.]
MVRALIFDFDGLILDTETPLVEAWARVHVEAGVAFDRRLAHSVVGHVDVAFDPWSAFPQPVDRAQLEEAYRKHKHMLVAAERVLPGVEALLDAAHTRGLRLGVASNSEHAHVDGHLQRLGLFGRFHAIGCRDDVRVGKPAPDVYQHVMHRLGVTPAQTIAFEDSVPGHEAAHAAGIRVVVVPNPSTADCAFPCAWWQIPSLAEVSLDKLLERFGM